MTKWLQIDTFTPQTKYSLALESMFYLFCQRAGKCNNLSRFATVEWNFSCPSSESASWLRPLPPPLSNENAAMATLLCIRGDLQGGHRDDALRDSSAVLDL